MTRAPQPMPHDFIAQISPQNFGRDAMRHARSLYWRGWTLVQISEECGLNYNTIKKWPSKYGWDAAAPLNRVEDAVEARLITLVDKMPKTGADYKEIDLLFRQLERTARVRRYEAPGGHEGDLNAKVAHRNAAPKKKPERNVITHADYLQLLEVFLEENFAYQNAWWAQRDQRTRKLLKSRQTGATFYFAREGLMKALESGRNQIFLSASKRQAEIFKRYICAFVQKQLGIKLTGDPIIIDRGEDEEGNRLEPVTLFFLATNAKTAQGEHGDFYFDEFFWTHSFTELKKVASAMATHKQYKRTYFSTPSTMTHEAYGFWAGDEWNKNRNKASRQAFNISEPHLRDGAEMPDGSWCQILTIETALARGADALFDIEELRRENSPDAFENLYMCQFVDDSQSKFPMALLNRCMVDSYEDWPDFIPIPEHPYPFGTKEVWLGYDPQESINGDNAALVVVAAPERVGGVIRVLEKFQWKGLGYEEQAARIQALTRRYHVTFIGIDVTGVGGSVFQLVQKFFPAVRDYRYSIDLKGQMVLKCENLMRNKRLAFDRHWTDVAHAFLSIRPKLTQSQRQITYVAQRSDETGHADLAWAIMHAVYNEPLDGGETPTSTLWIG